MNFNARLNISNSTAFHCGVFYATIIISGIYAEGYARQISQPHSSLFKSSIAADLIMVTSDIIVAVLLYKILQPAAGFALFGALFRFLQMCVYTSGGLLSLIAAIELESCALCLNLHQKAYPISVPAS